MKRRRDPTPEDRALWAHVTRDVRPLESLSGQPAGAEEKVSSDLSVEAAADPSADSDQASAKQTHPAGQTAMDKVLASKGVSPEKKDGPPAIPALDHGKTPGVDRRQSDRVRKGRAAIGARIDLHGMGRDQAHGALIDFVLRAHAEGHRTVLVITGKGRFSARRDDLTHEPHSPKRGLLQTMVPRWLNDAPLRQKIIGFHMAQPRHGGSGAIYVMLRRRADPQSGDRF